MYIEFVNGPQAGNREELDFSKSGKTGAAVFRIGRAETVEKDGKTIPNNLIIETDGGISRTHCEIRRDAESGSFLLSDAGSTRGTFIDFETLPLERGAVLRNGMFIRLNKTVLRIVTE
jgi:pSer/pThr/pTyr-binding forkhead associated (FHA) protein